MIVRVLEDGQYELDNAKAKSLDALDHELEASLADTDDERFHRALEALITAVHQLGTQLDPSTIVPSTLVVPSSGATREEVLALLSSHNGD